MRQIASFEGKHWSRTQTPKHSDSEMGVMKDIYEPGLQEGQLRGGLNCVLASDTSDQ